MTREMCMATPEDQKPPIDYRSPVAKDPRYRQRHDIPWSQPLPRWPPTLAEEPLPAPAKPEPYRPKVGERVRLISSPCEGDFELLDKELEILDVRKPGEAYYLPRSHYACRAASVYPDRPLLVDIHRDAVWEPVAEKPEPPASEPSGKPGVKELFDLWWNRVGTSARVSPRCTFEGGFDTGRASLQAELEAERAAHEKTREDRSRILQNEAEQDEEIERLRAERDKYLAEVGRVTVAHEATKAELAESRALHEELTDRIEVELAEAIMGLVKERSESVQALSRLVDERAAHEVTKERKARPMPTMEDLGRAFFDKAQEIGVISETVNWEEAQLRGGHRSAEPYWFTLAKVALRLFGAQEEQDSAAPVEPENTPPDPLPEVLPAQARTKYGTPLGGWIKRLSHDPDDGFVYESASGSPRRFAVPDQVDWAHWRSQQSQETPVAPAQPSLEGMPKPWRERLQAVEKFLVTDHGRLSELEQWQRHVEAHHQPAEHSRRIGELAKRLRKLEKGE
jgi:hypothetical protein